jgi:hypothetical protein
MSEVVIGPLEERYRHSQAFRNASDQTKLRRRPRMNESPEVAQASI